MDALIQDRIEKAGVIAVVSLESSEAAVPLARALLAGGVSAIELTLRSPAALAALELLCKEVPELLIGAGTVLTTDQVRQVRQAGAAFAVAPGLNRRVVEAAQQSGLPFAPGICTPSDIEAALELGCRCLKFFPSEPLGGLKYLRSVATPYAHLGLRFVPLGGLSADNAAEYLREPSVIALGGSWIAPSTAIRNQDWDGITRTARQAGEIVAAVRAGSTDG